MSDCCSDPMIVEDPQIGLYCSTCYNMTEGPMFECIFTEHKTSPRNRENKFFCIVTEQKIPWYVRQTLLDLFPKMEGHFHRSTRTNFIHMHQLVQEMLKVCGYPQYCCLFKSLKTPHRVKLVSLFVRDAIGEPCRSVSYKSREDLEMTVCVEPEVDMTKVHSNGHIYSDRLEKKIEKNSGKN